jgi:hypothetical protein
VGFMVNHATHHAFNMHRAAVAGIEPASRRLTVAFPYQHRTHRIGRMKDEGRGMNWNRRQRPHSSFILLPLSF